ncbi:uncharacterized protein [Ptychodera flava]|uniref:uncharacterized protein n=1 Tax=Ptychodera flava TaxID=63121 RepID=UPI003969E01D
MPRKQTDPVGKGLLYTETRKRRNSPSTAVSPETEARKCVTEGKDIPQDDRFEIRFIDSVKGKGVFAAKKFKKGDYLMWYSGERLSQTEATERETLYDQTGAISYMYFFKDKGKCMVIDATKIENVARYVNDGDIKPNSVMKKVCDESDAVHLCLFAQRDIDLNEEIVYGRGLDLPWRKVHKDACQASDQLSACVENMSDEPSRSGDIMKKNSFGNPELPSSEVSLGRQGGMDSLAANMSSTPIRIDTGLTSDAPHPTMKMKQCMPAVIPRVSAKRVTDITTGMIPIQSNPVSLQPKSSVISDHLLSRAKAVLSQNLELAPMKRALHQILYSAFLKTLGSSLVLNQTFLKALSSHNLYPTFLKVLSSQTLYLVGLKALSSQTLNPAFLMAMLCQTLHPVFLKALSSHALYPMFLKVLSCLTIYPVVLKALSSQTLYPALLKTL